MQRKSLIDQFTHKNQTLNCICLVDFVANYDTKTCKTTKCDKLFFGSFTLHNDAKNHHTKAYINMVYTLLQNMIFQTVQID
jgi:hypothetical protein